LEQAPSASCELRMECVYRRKRKRSFFRKPRLMFFFNLNQMATLKFRIVQAKEDEALTHGW